MSSLSQFQKRIDIETLSNIKTAWSSPTNCLHSNWCRIPSAVIIFLGLLILFTFFCCCAQCLSCCCCRGRKRPRGFDDVENGGQRLLPHSSSFAQTDLPVMPSYSLDELKKPKYAVIGDDGSVTTEDPERRLREDFPSPTKETMTPVVRHISQETLVTPPKDIFAASNAAFHDNLLNQNVDTSYNPTSAPTYPPSYRTNSQHTMPYSAAPAPYTSAPRSGSRMPLDQRVNYKTSRGQFNEGGPFPIIGSRKPVATSRPLPNPSSFIRGRNASPPRRPSPPRFESHSYQQPGDETESTTPYPLDSPSREDYPLSQPPPFDPYRRDF